MAKNNFAAVSGQEFLSGKDIKRVGATVSMRQSLEEERIFHSQNKWEALHVQSRWKTAGANARVGQPSRKLRKMSSRNILLTMFDNLLFLPFYLFEQACHQPKRAAASLALLLLIVVCGSSVADQLDGKSKYRTQLKNSVLQSVRYLQHKYLPHCC